MLRITFLGTSGGLPSPQRNLSSIALEHQGEVILFDCGEGTQRQMMHAKIGFPRRMKVFLTHLHGDHALGLPGLLQTISLLGRREPLQVYGPPGTSRFIQASREYVHFSLRFPLEVSDVESGKIYEDCRYRVVARWSEHSVPNLAYAFVEAEKPGKFHPTRALRMGVPKGPLWHQLQHGGVVKLKGGRVVKPEKVVDTPRPGVKIVYSGDTSPCRGVLALAKNADILIHECTFDDELTERAKVEWHSTPTQTASLAKRAGVKRLILTHISTRYKNAELLLRQARKTFRKVQVAEDFMQVEL